MKKGRPKQSKKKNKTPYIAPLVTPLENLVANLATCSFGSDPGTPSGSNCCNGFSDPTGGCGIVCGGL